MCLQSHRIGCADKTCFRRPGHNLFSPSYCNIVETLYFTVFIDAALKLISQNFYLAMCCNVTLHLQNVLVRSRQP